jgi:DedD protein
MNTVRPMMDRRVKERLVGATILVALIVLVVPELLSGPKRAPLPPPAAALPTPTRNVRVDLATSKATPEPQGVEVASTASAPSPAASAPPSAEQSTGQSTAASEGTRSAGEGGPPSDALPESTPGVTRPTVTTLKAQDSAQAPLETQPSSPKSTPGAVKSEAPREPGSAPQGRHVWAVQLGSFASKVNADKLAQGLMHQLQAHGGPSVYVISSGSGPSLRYRVRMGPLADRSAAERAVVKLKAQGHAATIVMPAS